MMFEAEFELETITPIFMRGADQSKAEIRAASIKGLMRWWFRALAHGVLLGNLPEKEIVKKVKMEEDRIFGSTKEKSKFSLCIKDIQMKEIKIPRQYYFSFGISKNDYGLMGKFTVDLQILDSRYKNIIMATFLTFGILGSVGQKSRRAFGSITVKKVSPDIDIDGVNMPLKYTPSEISNLLNWAILIFEKYFKTKMKEELEDQPKFPAIHPKFFRIKIGNRYYSNWEQAVQTLSKELRNFREDKRRKHTRIVKSKPVLYHVTKQYNEVKKAVAGVSNVNLWQSAFGLPHQYNFFSMNIKGLVIEGEKHSRRASSLMFKVVKQSETRYVPLVIFTNYVFLPNDEKLQIRHRKTIKAKGIRQPSLVTVQDFFDNFEGVEVKWGGS